MKREYNKLPLSFKEQALLLQSRGLVGDFNKLVNILRSVNYYRITGFLFPFRIPDSENFMHGTTVDKIWSLYSFDRKLRTLLFECVSRIEIAIRTRIAQIHSTSSNDPFCHIKIENFDIGTSIAKKQKYDRMLARIRDSAVTRAKTNHAIKHYRESYLNPDLPVWMAVETIEFGVLPVYYELLPLKLRIEIAKEFGVTDKTFQSWLTMIKNLRNACAHHERLLFTKIPTIGVKKYCDSRKNVLLTDLDNALSDENDERGTSLYTLCCILVHIMKLIRPESSWHKRLRNFILDDAYGDGRAALPVFSSDQWPTFKLWQ